MDEILEGTLSVLNKAALGHFAFQRLRTGGEVLENKELEEALMGLHRHARERLGKKIPLKSRPFDVKLSKCSQFLATTDGRTTLRFYDLHIEKEVLLVNLGITDEIRGFTMSHSEQLLFLGGQNHLYVFSRESESLIQTVSGPVSSVLCLQATSDDKEIYAVDGCQVIHCALQLSEIVVKYTHSSVISCLALTADNDFLVFCDMERGISRYDIHCNRVSWTMSLEGNGKCMSFSADSSQLACGTDTGYVYKWEWNDLKDFTCIPPIEIEALGFNECLAIDLHSEKGLVAAGNVAGHLYIWNLRSLELIVSDVNENASNLNFVKFVQDGNSVVYYKRSEGVLKIWEFPRNDLEYEIPVNIGVIREMLYSSTRNLIIISTDDSKLGIYSLLTNGLLKEIQYKSSKRIRISISPDEHELIVTVGKRAAYQINLDDYSQSQLPIRCDDEFTRILITKDKKYAVLGSSSGKIYLYDYKDFSKREEITIYSHSISALASY